jgi:hypothetical protein
VVSTPISSPLAANLTGFVILGVRPGCQRGFWHPHAWFGLRRGKRHKNEFFRWPLYPHGRVGACHCSYPRIGNRLLYVWGLFCAVISRSQCSSNLLLLVRTDRPTNDISRTILSLDIKLSLALTFIFGSFSLYNFFSAEFLSTRTIWTIFLLADHSCRPFPLG